MIDRELQIEAFDAKTTARLWALFDPPEDEARPARSRGLLSQLAASSAIPEPDLPPRGALPAVVLTRGAVIVRAFVPGSGVVPSGDLLAPWEPRELARWRARHGYAFVVVLRSEALPALARRVEQAVASEADLAAQALGAARALLPAIGSELLIEPALWGPGFKLPSRELLQRTFDGVLPADRTFALFLFRRTEIWASVIARKRGGDVDLITSHQALTSCAPSFSLAAAPRICAEVDRRFATPHIAAFVPLASWRRFVDGDRSALAAALAARQAVIDPCPRWLLALIGAGALSEVARRSARLAGRLLASSPLGGVLGRAPEQLADKLGNPLEALGLDPWELIRWARLWSRRALPLVLAGGDALEHGGTW